MGQNQSQGDQIVYDEYDVAARPTARRPRPMPAAVSARPMGERRPLGRVAPRITLKPLTNQPQFLQEQICPYAVHERRRIVEDVVQPMYQTIYQPVIQTVVRQARPVLDTDVLVRVQPVLHQKVVPELRRVVRNAPAAPVVRRAAAVEEVRLPTQIRQERVPVQADLRAPCARGGPVMMAQTVGGGPAVTLRRAIGAPERAAASARSFVKHGGHFEETGMGMNVGMDAVEDEDLLM
jgi:hypothetical protein